MSLEHLALHKTDDFPIKHVGKVHSGKVRSVYWLGEEDSRRLILERHYDVPLSSPLGVMIVSDRISAFDCNWHAEEGLKGVPGKGAALNAISKYWFNRLKEEGIGHNHLLDSPHSLVWIVQKARPVLVEAIARQYITGNLWRAYEGNERDFCGIKLPEGLQKDQKLSELLITPTTKGTLRRIPGVPEEEDAPISIQQVRRNYQHFQFYEPADMSICLLMLKESFALIAKEAKQKDSLLVDTKMEFGYVMSPDGVLELIFQDEMATPDSSRFWDKKEYEQGRVVENSKEGFRQYLLSRLDREVLLKSERFAERKELAGDFRVPVEEFLKVSKIYQMMAEKITGNKPCFLENPREDIKDVLSGYRLME